MAAAVKQTRKKRGPAHGEPGPGRPKGSKNRTSKVALEALRDRGLDPLEILADELAAARKEGDRAGSVEIAFRLLPFCYPKRKAVDLAAADEPLTVVWKVPLRTPGKAHPGD